MLPESLLCLLSVTIAYAQRPQLAVNSVTSHNTLREAAFAIPAQGQLSISVAVCSDSTTLPRFFVTNVSNADSQNDPGSDLGLDVFEIALNDGQGSWTGSFANGGLLSAVSSSTTGMDYNVGVSTDDTLTGLPLLGDTTATQAIIFSPPFLDIEVPKPTYPNYTLPSANLTQPPPPTNAPNLTLIVTPTSNGFASNLHTGCLLSKQTSSGTIVNASLWARDGQGWRTQWLLDGLTPSTNYTAFVLQDTTRVSGPIYFATKSDTFACPLVHSLPYCPGVAYAVPLDAPPAGSFGYNDTNLPTGLVAPLVSYIANFTQVLTTFACGRDWYSPIMGCDDCQHEYRKWLCNASFTRCTERSVSSSFSGPQEIFSAIAPTPSGSPRNQFLPQTDKPFDVLLPCLEQCNAMDRACPPFVGIQCPTSGRNAAASYGVGYIDGDDGTKDGGRTGAAQDRYGNVWCNMV
ncbi:hypothetical protein D9619_008854 [Psilocybe cf. subviscida]|uniref:FZ domain-containing protein n=1 Tax=Psilocybe cf. subviscida TaxID=2480587 RepID=A0A8H5F119_9AGAR|nr:hypothetical protein D9619_008854 [Psilocybe cf. subviscida]